MTAFVSPSDIVHEQSEFSGREVGVTHPDLPSFIRLGDGGDIEISAGEGLGIILNPRNRSITLIADHVNIMTKHEGGLRWNKVAFNDRAVHFNEPTFMKVDDLEDNHSIYKGVDAFIPEHIPAILPTVRDSKNRKVSIEEIVEQIKRNK